MRKIYFVLLCCIVLSRVNAQNYTPFPEKTAVWDIYIQYSEPDPRLKEYNRYTMEGDTIIHNLSYNKVYCSHYSIEYPSNKITMTKMGYCFGMRQDIASKKIYRTLSVNNAIIDTLLYDYNLAIGDTVPVTYTTGNMKTPQTVEGIDSILFHGKKYRRFRLKTIGMHSAALIEGVGNANGLIEPHYGFFEGAFVLEGFCDTEYHDCKTILALAIDEEQKDDHMKLFPNPFSNELTIQFKNEAHRELVIINMLGQEVQRFDHTGKQVSISRNDLKKGIYFLKVTDQTGIYIRKIVAE